MSDQNDLAPSGGALAHPEPAANADKPKDRTYSQAEVDAILKAAYPILSDGPHKITDHRRWLARQLLDSQLSEEEAYGIVRYSPGVNSSSEVQPVGSERSPAGPCEMCGGSKELYSGSDQGAIPCDFCPAESGAGVCQGSEADTAQGNLPPADPLDTSRHVDGAGWQSIDSAPRDGTKIKVRGRRGPYGLTAWEAIHWWGQLPNRSPEWLCVGGYGVDASAHLAGWIALEWQPPAALASPLDTSGRVEGDSACTDLGCDAASGTSASAAEVDGGGA